eukprot:gene10252-biopygen2895
MIDGRAVRSRSLKCDNSACGCDYSGDGGWRGRQCSLMGSFCVGRMPLTRVVSVSRDGIAHRFFTFDDLASALPALRHAVRSVATGASL